MSLERSFAINSCSPDNTEKDLLEGLLLARGGGQLVCAQEVGESVAKEGSDYIYGLQIPTPETDSCEKRDCYSANLLMKSALKIPQIGQFKWQELFLPQFWGLAVHDLGASRSVSGEASLPGLQTGVSWL